MISLEQRLHESIHYIRQRVEKLPSLAIILGSGLGDFADTLPDRIVLTNTDIPYYPTSTVEGHKGRLVFGSIGKQSVLICQGRVHFYESRNLETVLYPIYVAHGLGIETLIVTNAAGGISRQLAVGDLMIVTDQIDLTLEQPVSEGVKHRSPRRELYSKELAARALQAAAAIGTTIKKGVYAGMKGPSYETAAEVEAIHRVGGDAVGMSTVAEVALAASLGLNVLGISCITNRATGIHMEKLDHSEVTEVANRVKHTFGSLLTSLVEQL